MTPDKTKCVSSYNPKFTYYTPKFTDIFEYNKIHFYGTYQYVSETTKGCIVNLWLGWNIWNYTTLDFLG